MFRDVKTDLLDTSIDEETIYEFANQLKINDSYEQEISGLNVLLRYHAPTSSFIGVVENTTNHIISKLGVEIYLSNAVELGPTKRMDLKPGEMKNIVLLAYNQDFKEWNVVVDFE